MNKTSPTMFAAGFAVLLGVIGTIAYSMGWEIHGAGTTNLMISWGIVSICHAIEWHAEQRRYW